MTIIALNFKFWKISTTYYIILECYQKQEVQSVQESSMMVKIISTVFLMHLWVQQHIWKDS